MTVKELKQVLADMPEETEIRLYGNGWYSLDCICMYEDDDKEFVGFSWEVVEE